jgi:hypothetical protein
MRQICRPKVYNYRHFVLKYWLLVRILEFMRRNARTQLSRQQFTIRACFWGYQRKHIYGGAIVEIENYCHLKNELIVTIGVKTVVVVAAETATIMFTDTSGLMKLFELQFSHWKILHLDILNIFLSL